MYIIVGLGNPGEEYSRTRHNTGHLAVEYLKKKRLKGVKFFHPDTFMNKSGSVIAKVVKSKKATEKLIVIHDDLDLPLGILKISYNRGSGGHRGVESIIRALKTKEFIRIRIGIGKRVDVDKHILGQFNKSELETLKKVFPRVSRAIEAIVEHSLPHAMTEFNS